MSKELIFKALRHEETERIPWIPFVGVHAGKLVGYDATEMLSDGNKMLEGILEAAKIYSPDGMPVIFDLQLEAEILGCELVWASEAPPSVKTHPLAETTEIPCSCTIPRKTDGRIPMVLDVMKKVKSEIGETTALYGLICGPFTLASHLRGNDIFMDMYDDEDYVHDLMGYCTKVAKKMAEYYIDAGMDVIAIVDPLVSQISPDAFNDFVKEPFTLIFDYIRSKGVFSSFFVCGNATRNIEPMCQTNPDSIAVDENVNMVSAKEITDRYNITLSGNIPLTTIMLHGNQQDNMKYVVEELIDKLSHKNLIVSPGCDMPFNTPPENTIAAAQAVINTQTARKVIENYQGSAPFAKAALDDIHVELPDYKNLSKPLIEVCTLDSETCAACTYMMDAANVAKAQFGDTIDVIEYKYTRKEDIVRFMKMGVKNLPSIYINGELAYSSIIPNKEEFAERIRQAMK